MKSGKIKYLLLADKDDYMVTCVENETADFYCTENISEFIRKKADINFIDFGAVCSVYYIGEYTWELRLLVKHIRENHNRKYYFCLMMPSDFYNEYDEVWGLSNVFKVTYSEWVKGNAIKQILSGTYKLTHEEAK